MIKKVGDFFKDLWNKTFVYWFVVSVVNVLLFDLFWMAQTTFRPMSYFNFYPVLLLSALFLSLPSLFFRYGVIQTIWLLIFDTLFIANLMYCRTYFTAIPFQSYALIGNLSDFTDSVTDSFKWYFGLLPSVTVAAFVIFRLKMPVRQLPGLKPYFASAAILVFMVWIADLRHGGTVRRMNFLTERAHTYAAVTPVYSLVGHLAQSYLKSREKLSAEDSMAVREWLNKHDGLISAYWTESVRLSRNKPKNLVIILCESLESWVIGNIVEDKEITPVLNRLIADSSSFYAPNVITQVGPGRSIDGQLLVSAGQMPMRDKVYAYNATDNVYFTIGKAFKQMGGGRVLQFTPDKPEVWNQFLVATAFGVDSLIHSANFAHDEMISNRVSDRTLFRQTADKLQNDSLSGCDDRFMTVIVTLSGHQPFELPEKLKQIHFSGNYPSIIADYMTAANFTDASLMPLIGYLKSRDDWNETMVVITGDHEGLAAYRKDALAHPESAKFVDPLQHTPLIILNSPISGTFDGQLGQVDIYSTILDLMGFDNYPWRGMGMSIFDPNHPKVAVDSNGNLYGDTDSVSPDMLNHLKESPVVGDKILKFNMLSGN